jgi:hypothetical protein
LERSTAPFRRRTASPELGPYGQQLFGLAFSQCRLSSCAVTCLVSRQRMEPHRMSSHNRGAPSASQRLRRPLPIRWLGVWSAPRGLACSQACRTLSGAPLGQFIRGKAVPLTSGFARFAARTSLTSVHCASRSPGMHAGVGGGEGVSFLGANANSRWITPPSASLELPNDGPGE